MTNQMLNIEVLSDQIKMADALSTLTDKKWKKTPSKLP